MERKYRIRGGRAGPGLLGERGVPGALLLAGVSAMAMFAAPSQAALTCERTVTADIVAFDKPLMYNRLGASNVNGMMFALRRDVINVNTLAPLTVDPAGAVAGQVDLRPDKRPRPLVLRIRKGDCLTVNLQNLLTPAANPFDVPKTLANGQLFNVLIDDQVVDRTVGFHAAGLQLVNGTQDDGSFVGANASSLVAANGGTVSYKLYAAKEGAFAASAGGSVVGSDANQGNSSNGLFGQVIVEPTNAAIYRSQVFEEELRLATTGVIPGSNGLPQINYEATYPNAAPWIAEGKAGLPIINMMQCPAPNACTIVHSEINGVIAYGPDGTIAPAPDGPYQGKPGHFPRATYPLESAGTGKRNPTVPNRLEPFRDFASLFHDEPATAQAFPGFYVADPVFRYVLAGVKDGFMINYGSGGIGSEIIANRLLVGPMHDCASCAYEEFFLTSFAVADPGMTVDIPANQGLETLLPGQAPPPGTQGPKANYAIGAEDPANIHHSYTGDFVKFRNTHIGKEQHVFHLHNHQWLYNPNDDNSNYIDAQGIGPGIGYTYEINFGGSGNRNKTSGDAIFHCHFYPHFAQGMWYHWRHNDTFQLGTILAATPNTQDAQGFASAAGFHANSWDLGNTTPAAGARAYPDGEIAAGTPIPALVPLPGKAMAPAPAKVTVVAKVGANGLTVGSNASVSRASVAGADGILGTADDKNPGFPFWVAGMEDVIGQRPPTPVLDMLSAAQATALKNSGNPLWADINPAQADGFDGGLPRHALQGYADGAATPVNVVSPIDFSKVLAKAQAVFYPEEGTDLEQVAMAFHAVRNHSSFTPEGAAANFVLNGAKPVVGAPYHNPCIDDEGAVLHTGVLGKFFGAELTTMLDPAGMTVRGASAFDNDKPRIYKATNLQFDAVLTKTGYHFPQQRIVALWQDVGPVTAKTKPPEPLVMRLNTFDCAVFHHSNLVPEVYEIDDYQVRTPTDVIGQHIHLPKWDLTTTDGAANGWNYEDGTLSPGAVRERIEAINCFNGHADACHDGALPGPGTGPELHAQPHPFFASVAAQLDGNTVGTLPARETFAEAWLGARTTTQRWFADPVVNTERTDRGLGIIFTHDHYGPSTHQQIGLYSTVLTEPAASWWAHNETGTGLGCTSAVNPNMPAGSVQPNTTPCRWDGGPTSWQAAILPQAQTLGQNVGAGTLEPYREFYFEYSDFQHAYEAGVYMGTNQMGLPLAGTGPALPPVVGNEGNAAFNNNPADAFRFAINPPAREQINPVFPDLVLEVAGGILPGCPTRPCPQAIDVQDPGFLVVNYRAEPVALRIYDPNKIAPDGKPGMQADGQRGDLAFALQSRNDRAIPALNVMPDGNTVINGTRFPPHINAAGFANGDPFTPMIRTFQGDLVRVKMQAGGHEEEHNASIHGMKWLQAGSGHGKAPNSGWRNAQAGGISEQFTLSVPVVAGATGGGTTDYMYTMDGGNDGWWSGMWGILRAYDRPTQVLTPLPTTQVPVRIANANQFRDGLCPNAAPRRLYDISAVLANAALAVNPNVTIQDLSPAGHIGGGVALNPAGGTLVYNPRTTSVGGGTIVDEETGEVINLPQHNGPLHDPTAILYVRTGDLVNGKLKAGLKPEPVVIRANAGECIQVTLRNNLPALDPLTGNSTTPELATYSTMLGVTKRDRFLLEGSTTFQTNLFRASSWVGLTPQLAAFPVDRSASLLVGANPPGQALVQPGQVRTMFWYAGDITANKGAGNPNAPAFNLVATPVEFGGANLLSADRVKQGAKSAVGTLAVLPPGSTWTEDADNAAAVRKTRTSATVSAGGSTFRDHSLVLTKGLTQVYADSSPVEHMNGEGVGIPEDSQEASGMAVNYGVEPLWFRAGILPQSPFGNTGYGGIAEQHALYSNAYPGVGGDPATPVITSAPGQATRIHITNPFGTTRGSTFALHGHLWQRDPYVCPGEARNGLTGACNMTGVGSRALGVNRQGFAQGGQESWNAPSHFDVVLPGATDFDGRNWPAAGGDNAVAGDYLFRDQASFGNASGVWGIFRVQ